jgi:hypothetical protein
MSWSSDYQILIEHPSSRNWKINSLPSEDVFSHSIQIVLIFYERGLISLWLYKEVKEEIVVRRGRMRWVGQVFQKVKVKTCQFLVHCIEETRFLSKAKDLSASLRIVAPCFTWYLLVFYSFMCNTTNMFYKFIKNIRFKSFLTTCFDQCGHHQVLKIMDDETAVFCFVAYVVNIQYISPLDAHACLCWWFVFSCSV